MKTTILFLTLLVLSSSCTSIITKTMNSKETIYLDNPAVSPSIDQNLVDIHLGHSFLQGVMSFCYDCGKACFRRGKNLARCKKFVCRCTISKLR
ncbi:unnamed protein product [Arabidopsis thaliana]|uniref:Uncharacterized protein n=1 Tax=Arabidopsis thaliana TaxID=3702 RepID=A0A5S9XQJ5_ARATH|nr:unnamed protein product [Arabidopsis thaliana]VYS62050.1 unnamed protein product [Arabidopsis thaliana]